MVLLAAALVTADHADVAGHHHRKILADGGDHLLSREGPRVPDLPALGLLVVLGVDHMQHPHEKKTILATAKARPSIPMATVTIRALA